MPSLRTLRFGSKWTTHIKLLCLQVLIRKKVQIIVDDGQDVLEFPPFECLGGNELGILNDKPEHALKFLTTVEKQFSLLSWLLEEPSGPKRLNLEGLEGLLNFHIITRNVKPILSHPQMETVGSLTLSSCGLKECPDLASFRSMTCLDIKDNIIREWTPQKHQDLQTLILTGNPIPAFSDDFEGFPKLKYLELGSRVTSLHNHEIITQKSTW